MKLKIYNVLFYRFEVYIEMAANGMFGVGKDGMINPPDPDRKFSLSMAEIAVRDDNIQKIICDLKLLLSIAKVVAHS